MASDELIYIQTDVVTVTIKGSASHPSFPGVEFTEKESSLSISCDDPYDLDVNTDKDTLSYVTVGKATYGTYRLKPLFFEQQRYEIIIEPEEDHHVEFYHENYNIRKNVTPVGRKSNMLSGVINFGNDIGMSDLIIRVDGKNYLKITIEVFPSKIGYKDDYKAIVADVTSEVYNLVFDFLKKTYDSFDISNTQQSSPVEFFAIIKKIYDDFISAADMVIAKPHHMLETEHVVLPSHKIKRTDHKTIRWIENHPEHVKRENDRILIDKALAVKKHVTYDTKENRLTKYMLENTVKRLEQFKKQYSKLNRETDNEMLKQIDTMIHGIERRYRTGVLKEVQSNATNTGMSLVFSMAPGYRDLYRCYLLLQHGLSVTGSVFNVSVKDIAVLYEYWCFIKLNSLMKEKYELVSQDIIKVSGNGLYVSLVKGKGSRVVYRNPDNGEKITLSYNPKEVTGATVPQKPDNVLSLQKKGGNVDYKYVFDAKYKINPALEGSTYKTMYNTPGPQEDDINTMHRYRDAIVYQSNASPYERTMFGAYVLFPYRNEEEYKHHRFYQSIDQVNIGGLPFLPSTTKLVTELLDELITDSPQSAFERTTLPVGIEERLSKVDWSRRDVLIGTVRSHSQLNICLEHKFYYIPAKMITDEDLPIHYVAILQTPRVFNNEAGIYWYGEVLRTAAVLRKNIREVPLTHGNPDEVYYKFIIREWIPLTKPIMPKEYAFVHSFTNMFLLEHMETVPELLINNEEEYRLYTELKRRTGEVLENNNEQANGFELSNTKVLFDEGVIHIYKDGTELTQCTVQEFSRQPNRTFRRFQQFLKVNKN